MPVHTCWLAWHEISKGAWLPDAAQGSGRQSFWLGMQKSGEGSSEPVG